MSDSLKSPFKSSAALYAFLNDFAAFAISIGDEETASSIAYAFAVAGNTTATELLGELQLAPGNSESHVAKNDAYPQEMRRLFIEATGWIDMAIGSTRHRPEADASP